MRRAIKLIVFLSLIVGSACAQVAIEKSTEKVVINGSKYYLHTVESGQTLYSICRVYEVSEEDIGKANDDFNSKLKLGQVIQIPILQELSDDGEYIIHVVKSGDTLYSLCLKYGATEEEIIELNRKVKKNKPIKLGQEIKFPGREISIQDLTEEQDTIHYIYHTVEKGETFYSLVRTFNVSKEEILTLNPDLDANSIRIGQVIKFPKYNEVELTDQQLFIDSLAQVGLAGDTLELDEISICDTASWYKNGNDFKIVVLLPFEAANNMRSLYKQTVGNKDQRLYILTEKIVSFYSGLLVALDEFRTEDIDIEMEVFDVGKDNTTISELIEKKKFEDIDLIIGPAFKSQIEYLNDNLTDTCVSLILPFVNDDEILKKYANNIAIKTTEDIVNENIAKFVLEHPQYKYFIIQGDKLEQISAANEIYNTIVNDSASAPNVSKIRFNGKSLVSLKSMISKETENVFILPFANEAATMKILTELFPLKDYELTLLGNKSILNYVTIDPNYFRKVKFSYYSCQNVDYTDTLTNEFVSKYRDVFLCEPDEYSFMAYDAVVNLIPKLHKHGKGFSECLLCDEEFNGVSGKMRFVHKPNYAKKSHANSTIYIFTLQDDFTFVEVYPDNKVELEDDDQD